MDIDALRNLYDELTDLAAKGEESAAQELMKKRFTELPKEVQAEVLTRLYFMAAEDEAVKADALAAAQQRSLELAASLEALKAELEKGGTS